MIVAVSHLSKSLRSDLFRQTGTPQDDRFPDLAKRAFHSSVSPVLDKYPVPVLARFLFFAEKTEAKPDLEPDGPEAILNVTVISPG